MAADDIKRLVLEFIEKKPKGANWYNLEIALSRAGRGGDVNVNALTEELAREGLLQVSPGVNPGLSSYRITDSGRLYLKMA